VACAALKSVFCADSSFSPLRFSFAPDHRPPALPSLCFAHWHFLGPSQSLFSAFQPTLFAWYLVFLPHIFFAPNSLHPGTPLPSFCSLARMSTRPFLFWSSCRLLHFFTGPTLWFCSQQTSLLTCLVSLLCPGLWLLVFFQSSNSPPFFPLYPPLPA